MMKFKVTIQILVDSYNWQCFKQNIGKGWMREKLAQPAQISDNKIQYVQHTNNVTAATPRSWTEWTYNLA